MAPVVAFCFLPFFRRLSVTTAYEYLEYRFHNSLRLAGSAVYMLFQVGRVAVVTLLPALALSAVTGFDVTFKNSSGSAVSRIFNYQSKGY